MAHIIEKAAKNLCTDTLCRADWGQKRDCLIMARKHKDADAIRVWNLYADCHEDEARLVKADVESDNLATKQANRDVDKLLRKARKAPRTPRPPKPSQARQAARDRAALEQMADEIVRHYMPDLSARAKTPPLSVYSDDPREAEVAWQLQHGRYT